MWGCSPMQQCERFQGCKFFQGRIANMPHFVDVFQSRYCLGQHEHCARFRVAKQFGPAAIPFDMYPNDFEMADKILAGAQH